MAKRLSRIERDIERLKEKISEYQQQLKELEAAKTEQENLQIIQLVRSMNMKPDEFAAFLRSGALNAASTVTPYHKQEDPAAKSAAARQGWRLAGPAHYNRTGTSGPAANRHFVR